MKISGDQRLWWTQVVFQRADVSSWTRLTLRLWVYYSLIHLKACYSVSIAGASGFWKVNDVSGVCTTAGLHTGNSASFREGH